MTNHLVFEVDSVICKEAGIFHCLLISLVVRKLCQWQVPTAIVLLIIDVGSEVLFQYSIGSFGLAVCSWMESRAESSFNC